MKKAVLGLDINDDFLAAVVVEKSGQEKRIIGCGSVELDEEGSIAEALPLLLEEISWEGGASFCGIPLSRISLRNLSVPFSEKKKIAQVLPFELEDQLLTPVDDQIIEYSVTGVLDDTSHLMVVSLEKKELGEYLDHLQESNLNPATISLGIVTLAEQYLGKEISSSDILFLAAGLNSINMAIVHRGQIVFIRHLPYPERMFTGTPFSFKNGIPRIDHHDEAMECLASLCDDIKRGIGFFALDSGLTISPERIVLTGCMVHVTDFQDKIRTEFGQDVDIYDVQHESGVILAENVQDKWSPAFYNHALAIALRGGRKKQLINFRKQEFATEKLFLASQPQLIAATVLLLVLIGCGLAYLGFDYRALKTRYDDLGGKMQAIFKDTFPDRTKIKDPLVEMQASIRNIQAPSISTPVFSGDKRVLNILADISDRVPVDIEIHVSRLVIDQESVRVKGTTDTFNNVNIIQGRLRKSPLYSDVDIVSAAADKESKLIRFELRMDTGGAS